MHNRRKLALTMLLVLLAAALALPLAGRMSEAAARRQADDEALIDMHLQYEAYEQAGRGSAVLPVLEREALWAIEGSRAESPAPLIERMYNGEDELGYDAQSVTFYCSIAPGQAEWPELSLTARGAQGVQVAFIDDYAYDWCDEAVAQGYSYELIAYTETEYCYLYIVFTGMPIVTIHAEGEIGDVYIPGRATVSGAGYEAVSGVTLVHTRGGGYDHGFSKYSYRLEFHEIDETGKEGREQVSVLGMEADSDWLLLCNAQEPTAVRNELCWELWRRWNEGKTQYTVLDTRLVEVFVQDEYKGLFQLCERIDPEEEIVRMGGNLNTDAVIRLIRPARDTGRPVLDHMHDYTVAYELRHRPQNMSVEKGFSLMWAYEILNYHEPWVEDEEIIKLAKRCVDVEQVMDYYLFAQACSLGGDNVFNNLYIWFHKDPDGEYRLHLSPWDMDRSFDVDAAEGVPDDLDLQMGMTKRLLNMDALGTREMLHENFAEKRATILSDDALYQMIDDLEIYVNSTGAYLRESEKWRGGAVPLDLTTISIGTIEHMATIEYYLRELWPLNSQ